MNKIKGVIILSLFVFASAFILIIEDKQYMYAYYRIFNGKDFSGIDIELSPGFYFYDRANGSGEYTVFHKDVSGIPLFFDIDRKANFSGLMEKDLVTLIYDFTMCKVYRENDNNNLYIDFGGVLDAIVGVKNVSQENLLVLCEMVNTSK